MKKPNKTPQVKAAGTKEKPKSKPLWGIFIILLLVLAVFIFKSGKEKSMGASLYFEPKTINLAARGNQSVALMLNSYGKKIAFARVVVTFDPAKVRLGTELVGNPNLSTTVEKTSIDVANTGGKAVLVIAANPTDTQPSGNIELATFMLEGIEGATGDDFLSFDVSDMQIVDTAARELELKTENSEVSL